jgi:hypothetical protein
MNFNKNHNINTEKDCRDQVMHQQVEQPLTRETKTKSTALKIDGCGCPTARRNCSAHAAARGLDALVKWPSNGEHKMLVHWPAYADLNVDFTQPIKEYMCFMQIYKTSLTSSKIQKREN